jgi:hypothetical protein
MSRHVTCAWEPISAGRELAVLKIGQPMWYKGRREVYNVEVEMCGIFTTRNSLKLHRMQKSFSTIRNFSCHNAKVVLADCGDNGQVLIGQSPRHRHTFPHRGFLVWGFCCQVVLVVACIFSCFAFGQFLCSSAPGDRQEVGGESPPR